MNNKTYFNVLLALLLIIVAIGVIQEERTLLIKILFTAVCIALVLVIGKGESKKD